MIEITSARGLNYTIRKIIDDYRKKRSIEEPIEVKKLDDKNIQFTEDELKTFQLVINKEEYFLRHIDSQVNFDKEILKSRKDLFWVKDLYISNSEDFTSSDLFELLSNLPNIENIYINNSSLNKQEIQMVIDKYPNLKRIDIWEQHNIDSINLKNSKQLESIYLKSNLSLNNIYGLSDLENLKDFQFFDNPSYLKIDEVCEVALKVSEKKEISGIDALYFPQISKMIDKDKQYSQMTPSFLESHNYGYDNYLQYSYSIMSQFNEKAQTIVDKYILEEDSNIQKYAIIYQWMCENITYDRSKGKDKPIKHGSNGLINGFIHNNVICEGYTKMAQYLLSLCGIKSNNIACFTPNGTGHSIIMVGFGGIGNSYYSDITWDAERYQRKEEREYFLLSRNDMSKDHKIFKEHDIDTYNKSYSKEETDKLLEFAKERISNVNMITKQIEETMNVKLDTLDVDNLASLKRNLRRKLPNEVEPTLKDKMLNYLEQRENKLFKRWNEQEQRKIERQEIDNETINNMNYQQEIIENITFDKNTEDLSEEELMEIERELQELRGETLDEFGNLILPTENIENNRRIR